MTSLLHSVVLASSVTFFKGWDRRYRRRDGHVVAVVVAYLTIESLSRLRVSASQRASKAGGETAPAGSPSPG